MARPKLPTKEKVIRLLTKNPDKVFTYKELADKVGSHPLACGQILKSLYKTEYRNLTEQVIHSNPSDKKRKLECIARHKNSKDFNVSTEVPTSNPDSRVGEGV